MVSPKHNIILNCSFDSGRVAYAIGMPLFEQALDDGPQPMFADEDRWS